MAKNKHDQMSRELTALRRNVQLEAELRKKEGLVTQANQAAVSARILLMALLAQHGGQLEVTRGTLEQARANFPRLGWVMQQKGNDQQTYVVMLTEEGKGQ